MKRVRNKYQVPLKLWKEFKTPASKKIYNNVMKEALPNQKATLSPTTKPLTETQWRVICHNMATYAAWALAGKPVHKGTEIKREASSGDDEIVTAK